MSINKILAFSNKDSNVSKSIKLMVVDDSAVVRMAFTEIIASASDIELIATASDPIFAMNHMEIEWPDVIVLDIEMPRMDGITFLKKIMAESPVPVVICSTLTSYGAETTFQAMDAGALGIIAKPKIGLKNYLLEERGMLLDTIRAASAADLKKFKKSSIKRSIPIVDKHIANKKLSADAIIATDSFRSMKSTTSKIVTIGTSTGGTQALERVLTSLSRESPGMVIVQHMPEKFTKAFANRLNMICEIEVLEAKNGDKVQEGRALIAPGGKHMMLRKSGTQYYVDVVDGPLVNRHRPSVDVLFRSVANIAGNNAMGIIMTGMGDDGAQGICEMQKTGSITVAQDEESCVVFGMPKEAIKRGGIERIVSLDAIANEISTFICEGDIRK